jgi:hypothetical protein
MVQGGSISVNPPYYKLLKLERIFWISKNIVHYTPSQITYPTLQMGLETTNLYINLSTSCGAGDCQLK